MDEMSVKVHLMSVYLAGIKHTQNILQASYTHISQGLVRVMMQEQMNTTTSSHTTLTLYIIAAFK